MDVVLADLSVVVSELVTNALVHAYSAVASRRGGEAGPITLCLIHEPCESGMERVVFAVTDPSVESPLSPGLEDVGGDVCELWESGRGMTLVEALADDWGWRRVRSRDGMAPAGKIVWALFELAC